MREDDTAAPDRPGRVPVGAAAGGLYLLIVVISLLQQPGRTTYDTRAELTERPGSFLAGAFRLWHPDSNFGEVQNQAYGYLFPQGPWFLLTDWVGMPDWVSQRLWSALVLIVACEGARRVGRAAGLSDTGALLAGVAYGFTPRLLGTVPVISAESLPGAVMPWVVLPVLLTMSGRLGPRSAVALSGAAVVCMGGVNAVENAGSLPLAAILVVWGWRRGKLSRRFVLSWFVAVGVASLWWALPLLVLAAYAPPFYQYVESAADTTALIGWSEAVRGDTHWVAYLITGDQAWWPAAHALVTGPVLVCVSAAVAAIGLLGLARFPSELRRPMLLSVLVGLCALTVAHGGPAGTPLAETVRVWLDGPLQIFRNVHKIDPVVRLPIALGFGAAVTAGLDAAGRWRPALQQARPLLVIGALSLPLALGQPYLVNDARTPGWDAIPESWQEARAWLQDHAKQRTTLVVPGSGFAQHDWGWTIDEPLQVLGGVDRATRSQVPLIPGESIRYLAALDQLITTGRASPRLGQQLARAGIGHVLLRRDLDRDLTRSPHPGFSGVSLDQAGLRSVAAFGAGGEGGPEIEILEVSDRLPRVRTTPVDDVRTVRGAPESILQVLSSGLVGPDQATVLEGQPGWSGTAQVVTDGNQRRERAFGSNDEGVSALMTASEPWRAERAAHDFATGVNGPSVVAEYDGLDDLTASSAQGYADNFGPVTPQSGPYAAVDRDPDTRWVTSLAGDPTKQWLRMDLDGNRSVRRVSVLPVMDDREVVPVRELEVRAGAQVRRLRTNASGAPSVARFDGRRVAAVEVRVVRAATRSDRARVGIREIQVDGLRPYRTFAVPGTVPPGGAWTFSTEPDRRACVITVGRPDCSVARIRSGEERAGMDRTFELGASQQVRFRGRVVARATNESARLLEPLGDDQQVGATSFYGSDPKVSGRFAYDGEPTTAWVSSDKDPNPTMFFRWSEPQVVRGLSVTGDEDAPVAAVLRAGGRSERIDIARSHEAVLDRPLRTRTLQITFVPGEGTDRVVVPELELRGVDVTVPFVADTPTGARCGLGPVVRVDGRRVPTRVSGTMGDVANGRPLRLVGCAPDDFLLPSGEHRLRTPSTAEFQVVQLRGAPAGSGRAEVERRDATVLHWGDVRREVEVAPGADSLVWLPESYNPGWVATVDGTELPALRVDGWQQAWRLPASPTSVEVLLEYRPQRSYVTVLVTGLVAAALVLSAGVVALGAVLRRRGRRPAADPPWAPATTGFGPAPLVVVSVLLLVLLGVVPAAGFLVGVAACGPSGRLWRRWSAGRVLGCGAALVLASALVDVLTGSTLGADTADLLAASGVGMMTGVAVGSGVADRREVVA